MQNDKPIQLNWSAALQLVLTTSQLPDNGCGPNLPRIGAEVLRQVAENNTPALRSQPILISKDDALQLALVISRLPDNGSGPDLTSIAAGILQQVNDTPNRTSQRATRSGGVSDRRVWAPQVL
jgi:hypothetical protein